MKLVCDGEHICLKLCAKLVLSSNLCFYSLSLTPVYCVHQ